MYFSLFFFTYLFVKMGVLKENMQNKHIIFACKYVETWAYFPWTIRLMRDGPQSWERTEGIQEKYKEYKGVAS